MGRRMQMVIGFTAALLATGGVAATAAELTPIQSLGKLLFSNQVYPIRLDSHVLHAMILLPAGPGLTPPRTCQRPSTKGRFTPVMEIANHRHLPMQGTIHCCINAAT